MEKSVYVYHEKQAGALCGVHCLNTLFQCPIYTPVDLSNLASELDEHERQIMAMGDTESKEFLTFMGHRKEDSGNVADDGNFSVQVLAQALQKRGLECRPLSPSTFYSIVPTLSQQNAFICNKGSHWFTIRKIENAWYNLNSLLSAPEEMSDSQLATFIDNTLERKECVYLIVGELPDIPLHRPTNSDGRWIRVRGSEEADLALALQASVKDSEGGRHPPNLLPATSPSSQSIPSTSSTPTSSLSTSTSTTVTQQRKQQAYLSIPDMMNEMERHFEKLLVSMESCNTRIAALEEKLKLIQQFQHNTATHR